MQRLFSAEAFDRGHLAAVGAEGGRDAAVHRVAAEPYRAGTAIACVATLFDAVPAQRAHEGAKALARPRLLVERFAIDGVAHAAPSQARSPHAGPMIRLQAALMRPAPPGSLLRSAWPDVAGGRVCRSGRRTRCARAASRYRA